MFNSRSFKVCSFLICSGTFAGFVGASAEAQEQIQDQEILFGMSTAITGPASKLGLNMQAGVLAAFNEANAAGGVHGYTLELITLDDGYEPARTAPNMRALIEDHDVVAVVGNVGTPTAIAAIPIANEQETLLYGAYTGAGALRKSPPDRHVINYRASYAQETGAMVDALINNAGLSLSEIAFFTQRDGYGDAGFNGGINALKRHGLTDELVAHGRYERNTIAVENGLADILMSDSAIKAVIMVGAYAPCAEFIKLSAEYDFNPIFLNVSFVGSAPLANELGSAGNGVIITQVVPHYLSDITIAHEYHAALEQLSAHAQPSFGSFEGYIAGRVLIKALKQADQLPSRQTIVDAFESLGTFDIGLGQELTINEQSHQASTNVWPTIIKGGQVIAFTWDQLKNQEKGILSEAISD